MEQAGKSIPFKQRPLLEFVYNITLVTRKPITLPIDLLSSAPLVGNKGKAAITLLFSHP
jgi:hypothetical protein